MTHQMKINIVMTYENHLMVIGHVTEIRMNVFWNAMMVFIRLSMFPPGMLPMPIAQTECKMWGWELVSANFVLLAEIKLPHVACSIEIIFQLFLKRFSKFCNVANIWSLQKLLLLFAIFMSWKTKTNLEQNWQTLFSS